MFFRLRRSLQVRRYNKEVRAILDAPPLRLDPTSEYTLVSQVCHFDVLMWLVAAKSWARYAPPRRVWLLDDGSLTPADIGLLNEHVAGLTVVTRGDVENPRCPKGFFFERILLIADLVADSYVMQLDSDTVTTSEPTEAVTCIHGGTCFTLGTDFVPEVVPILEAQQICADRDWTARQLQHEQVQSELAFDKLSNPETRRYVRANAAFAGFARGAISRDDVESFSEEMEALLGERWTAWGTEQVTSNYLIANQLEAKIFHEPRYAWHAPGHDLTAACFVHFIGTHRFENGTYGRLSRQVAEELIDAGE
ncbi:MAG: hypothetical protein VX913_03010 [Planctomycetota bacterium]|nr:hypothetical protein [Planctomycetota bacterium]